MMRTVRIGSIAMAITLAGACERPPEGATRSSNRPVRSAAPSAQPSVPAAAADETADPGELPVDPRHRRLARTPAWLAGYWVDQTSACYGSDSGIQFRADGTYIDHETEGRYAVDGRTLRLTVTRIHNVSDVGVGEHFEVQFDPLRPNAIALTADANRQTLYRCPPADPEA